MDIPILYASGYDSIRKIQNRFCSVLATNALPESNCEETLDKPK